MQRVRKVHILTMVLAMAAAPLATPDSHVASDDRSWTVTDGTTASTALAEGEGGYTDCGANTSLVVKCSGATSWQTVSEGGSSTVSCGASDPSLHYAEGTYTQAWYSVSWDCQTGQNVTVSGTRTTCHSVNFTHSTSCQ